MRSVAVVVTVCALVSCAHEPAKSEAAPAPDAVPASANPNASANAVAKANSGDVAAPAPTLPASPGLPKPPLFLEGVEAPADNALTADKVDLGRALFFNPKLSKDGSMSCESCHHPAQAWTSGKVTDAKVGGKMNGRNAPTMTNLGLHQNGYYWDGRKATLEAVTEAAWTG
ncbi:MAG: cytochrome-c peroxidase, partial [Deltaproteobacteria bacterium]|nr:cytochrome-c peroxidase [Deltaproteobacteria bacterium]